MDCAINNKNLHSLLPPLGHMGALISEIKKAIIATKVIYGLNDSPKSHKRKKTKAKKDGLQDYRWLCMLLCLAAEDSLQ